MYRVNHTFIVLMFILALHEALHGAQAQPADSEGASLSAMPVYVQWVTSKCGSDPAQAKGGCAALKDALCGTRATSEVLCLSDDKGGVEARFRSASRYTRVGYLRCSLTMLKCQTDPETYSRPAHFVDPVSLAAWVQFTSKCTPGRSETTSTTSTPAAAAAAECAKLSGALCSRPDVKQCSKDAVEFGELGGSKQVVLRGDNNRGLVFLK